MRKYIKLVLILTALFSVLFMLIYRYKYYNLRSLLEIMNIFTSEKVKKSNCVSKHSYNNVTSEIAFNTNHWTEIFDGVYVYSLHVLSRKIISLAYSYDISMPELKSIQCNLWFAGQTKTFPSNLDIHLLSVNRSSFLYYIECNNTYDYGSPHAITFVKNNASVTLPLFHKKQYTPSLAACVSPLPPVYSDVDSIVEFFTYHAHLGIKHYIFYYTAFSEAVQELLVTLVNECDITIEFLPWITPPKFDFGRAMLKPFLIDCIFHIASLKHSDFVFLLDLNNFLVTEETVDLQTFLKGSSPFDLIELDKKMFCLEYPNYLIAEELNIKFNTLLKTKVSNFEVGPVSVIYNIKKVLLQKSLQNFLSNRNKQSYRKIKSTFMSIFSYSKCSKNLSDISYTENKKMWMFKQIFFESCIYKQGKTFFTNYTK